MQGDDMAPAGNASQRPATPASRPAQDRAIGDESVPDPGASHHGTTGTAGAGPCPGRWARRLIAAFIVAWSAALVGPPLALVRWREARLVTLADPAAQANWDVFREDMRRQSGRDGPVQRKVPRSAEPPERVWLRDYVGLAITAWVTLVGVLGGFLGLTLRGLLGAGAAPSATRRLTARG